MLSYERKLNDNSILIKIRLRGDEYWQVNYVVYQTKGCIFQECEPDYYLMYYYKNPDPLIFEYVPKWKQFIERNTSEGFPPDFIEYNIDKYSRLGLELSTLRHIIHCEKRFIMWYKLKYLENYLVRDVLDYIYIKLVYAMGKNDQVIHYIL